MTTEEWDDTDEPSDILPEGNLDEVEGGSPFLYRYGGDEKLTLEPGQFVVVDRQHSINREDEVIHIHQTCALELALLRKQRDALEVRIKVLDGEEYRLSRMVGIIERAREKAEKGEADGGEADTI